MINKLKEIFYKKYGKNKNELFVYFAPGRVNIIGEHTDYNGGFVLPCALSFGTYLLIRKANNSQIKFLSANFDFTANIPINKLKKKINGEWVNYPLGIFNQFIKKGKDIQGIEMLFSGNIPNGAGLSSSASIELVTSFAINELFEYGFDIIELIKLSQKAENEFVGVSCGIMDQFAVGKGKKNHALFLNCETLKYVQIPFSLNEYKLIIANTNKKRGLTNSKYNERVAECKKALKFINKKLSIKNLGELSLETFEEIQDVIPDEVIRRRAEHVVSEDYRVLEAVKAMENKNIKTLGKLMNASHDSLKNNYEVTGFELDTLVYEARKITGVIGSRMTGAGFGGCTVNIIRKNNVDEFCKKVGERYKKITGLNADFYLPEIGDGVRRLIIDY